MISLHERNAVFNGFSVKVKYILRDIIECRSIWKFFRPFVHGGTTQQYSTQPWKLLHGVFLGKKNSQRRLRSIMSRRLYFGLSCKISNIIRSVIRSVIQSGPVRSGPIQSDPVRSSPILMLSNHLTMWLTAKGLANDCL